MYELFYKFLIEELLVRYFKKTAVEPGDKFYIVIEDGSIRRGFHRALQDSGFTVSRKLCFPGYEKYGAGASEYATVAFTCTGNGTPVIVSGCDDACDGFQTMIRNNVGVKGNPASEMAALFILQGTNTIETLLSAGHNLQEKPYPLCLGSITDAINKKIENKINIIEKEYLRNHIARLRSQDNYTSLFDFAPVLSILQEPSLQHSFVQLDAFEDSEIYDNMFAANGINIKERVKDNTTAFALISDMMSEAYEQDQYKRLTTYLDPRLAEKISSGRVDWKDLNYNEIRKSHDIIVQTHFYRHDNGRRHGSHHPACRLPDGQGDLPGHLGCRQPHGDGLPASRLPALRVHDTRCERKRIRPVSASDTHESRP